MVDGITVNGVDIITWDADGLITHFKVMVRPLKAVEMLHRKMAAMLSAEEAAFDAMLKAKVEEAIADPRPSIPIDEAIEKIRIRIEARRAGKRV